MESTNVLSSPTPRMPGSLQALGRNLPLHHSKKAGYILSCKATDDGRVDRRSLLRLLGGTAATGLSMQRGMLAAPIRAPDPDPSNCYTIDLCGVPKHTDCCPPYPPGTIPINFTPPATLRLRVRPAAHLVDDDYVYKYEKAVRLMKQLPEDDPRSFTQQAHVHCAYCDLAYDQLGSPGMPIQIHFSWLFFPWHRLYLYFHERILASLVEDDTFALPFWNWDAPGGMELPAIYANMNSPLYDHKRNPDHQRPCTLDLDYGGEDKGIPRDELIHQNLKIMYREMISCPKKADLFLGCPYRKGDPPCPGAGSIEKIPHNTIHNWTGDLRTRQLYHEDMGNFYSAALDPVFFAHHGNVDRMWNIWRCLGNTNFTDDDWLDASFLFYDEERRLVRVRVRDCLDTSALGYTYQDVPLPWLTTKPTKAVSRCSLSTGYFPGHQQPAPGRDTLPARLDKTVRVTVGRTQVLRSREQKAQEEEVLIIEGIEVADHTKYVKFDVYVNEPEGGGLTAAAAECAGSVALTPHIGRHNMQQYDNPDMPECKVNTRFGISDLLEEIEADGHEKIVVSLVPRCEGELVTVGGVRIEYK